MAKRRTVMLGALFGAALAKAAPQAKRIFHMYTTKDGLSAIKQIPVPAFGNRSNGRLLRRPAERLTIGTMAPNYMMDFHIANQPNFLIPVFGTLVVELKDKSRWVFKPGDILFAEDCTGSGHRSGAGPDGCFSVSVQIAKTDHCLETPRDPADVLFGGDGPAV
jgi:hypothetical protein